MEGIGTKVHLFSQEGEFKEGLAHGKHTVHMDHEKGQIFNMLYWNGNYNHFKSCDLRFEDHEHFYRLDYPHQDREIGLEFAESTEE